MTAGSEVITGEEPILVRAPNGDQKVFYLKNGDRNLADIRLGKIRIGVKSIIGQKYGSTVCQALGSKSWSRIQGSEVCADPAGSESADECDVDENSSSSEHETGHARAAQSAANNPAFLSKSIFSQEKYLRKKQQKYSREVKILKPSLKDFCEAGVPPIRFDMLGSLLRFSAVKSSSVCGVVDDSLGIITTALIQRDCHVDRYVFGKATGQERAQCAFGLDKTPLLNVLKGLDDAKASQQYDTVVIALSGSSDVTIKQCLDALVPKLKLCGTIVCFSKYIEPLLELLYKLRENPTDDQPTRFINVQLTEQMLRGHEIVKERTHPIMKQSIHLFQGFILSGIKVAS